MEYLQQQESGSSPTAAAAELAARHSTFCPLHAGGPTILGRSVLDFQMNINLMHSRSRLNSFGRH